MLKPFIRKDTFARDSYPKMSIRQQHLGFNAAFVKAANLQRLNKVQIHVDEENFRLGFEFIESGDRNTFALFSDNPSNNTKAISAVKLIKSVPFLASILKFGDPLSRQFLVTRDNQKKNLWVSQLCPAFERIASSESDLKELKGIYRYKRANGEIVYIGRGNILSRLNSTNRHDWDFDIIEYSIITDSKEQAKWESYWLNKYVETEGKLPFYNKLKGKLDL